MRFFALAAALLGLLVFSGMAHAIDTANCADGTAYGKCSTKFPGQYCIGSIYAPTLGTLLSVCPCTNFPGYVQQGTGDDATCIAAKCSDNTESNKCSTAKPKFCLNGALVDNATKCGCPTGKKVSANGLTCDSVPCNDSGIMVPEGTCSAKKGKKCVNTKLVDAATECKCPAGKTAVGEVCAVVCSDGTADGNCSSTKPKKCVNGYLLDDAAACGCPSSQTAVGAHCSESAIGSLGGADLLGGTGATGNDTGTASGSSALSCCCLPTALIGIIGGFVLFRKRE